MAAIDKTYLNSYKDYQELIEWCKGKSFTLSNGDVVYPSEWIYGYWEEKDFTKDGKPYFRPVWNTPTYLDIWLIRNCPLSFIQDTLKEQYDDDFLYRKVYTSYQAIKDRCSIYDTWERNGMGKDTHYSIKRIWWNTIKDDDCWWHISISGCDWWYNEEHNEWNHRYEALPWTSNLCYIRGNIGKHKLSRLLKKWNLPKGTEIEFECLWKRHIYKRFIVTIK